MIQSRFSFDPRTQLFVLLVTSIAAMVADQRMLIWMIVALSCYLLIQGMYRTTLRLSAITGLIYAAGVWSPVEPSGLWAYAAFFVHLGNRMIPVLMAAVSIGNVPSGRLIASLRIIGLPMGTLIALTVSLRYLSVLKIEYDAIRVNAKQRGVSIVSPRNWLRPFRVFEHTVVPLLMRSLKIADELAASVATKGVDNPGLRTSLYPVVLRWKDAVVSLVSLVLLCVALCYGGAL